MTSRGQPAKFKVLLDTCSDLCLSLSPPPSHHDRPVDRDPRQGREEGRDARGGGGLPRRGPVRRRHRLGRGQAHRRVGREGKERRIRGRGKVLRSRDRLRRLRAGAPGGGEAGAGAGANLPGGTDLPPEGGREGHLLPLPLLRRWLPVDAGPEGEAAVGGGGAPEDGTDGTDLPPEGGSRGRSRPFPLPSSRRRRCPRQRNVDSGAEDEAIAGGPEDGTGGAEDGNGGTRLPPEGDWAGRRPGRVGSPAGRRRQRRRRGALLLLPPQGRGRAARP